ncbi:putative rust resistance kinase Lr10 [Oryza sativa Japonica Group]|uniref:Rust resistance kinase Lr10 n=1 Tax=Oryza sativa subsp. japonica TaxID=39947 RepID=Q656W9_ORYSJ|nr:putative rust resistance kinase Lr10 [Oryza sativa Japonica Group]
MEAAALSTVLYVLALVVADADHHVVRVQGRRHQCQPFSCGHLQNVSYPFRRRGDPRSRRCGFRSYELDCSSDDGKATIRINTGKYYVSSINYTASIFWVVDANLQDDANSSCPLPRSDQLPYVGLGIPGSHDSWDLGLDDMITWVGFVNCSQELITNSSSKYLYVYHPVDCLTTALSFVYYMLPFFGSLVPSVEDIEPSCGYLAMTPIGGGWNSVNLPEYTSYAEVVKSMRGGFAVKFPTPWLNWFGLIKKCLNKSVSHRTMSTNGGLEHLDSLFAANSLLPIPPTSPPFAGTRRTSSAVQLPRDLLCLGQSYMAGLVVRRGQGPSAAWRRGEGPPLVAGGGGDVDRAGDDGGGEGDGQATKSTMDGVRRLRMAKVCVRTVGRDDFSYSQGQGGYGSVYKGVFLPGDVHVAIKMLDGNSNCNGEDFISEVATIGRIHHINVVRLVGFCSEEMRRALVYEYMPRGSLNKYIFSSERSFSWDKLNEIALGIARGINYLHQGCEMQILHFDIKPDNILLDDNFVSKVADFGLAKLYPREKSFVSDRALRGTVGYMAPEMVSRSFGVISDKSDVYSFGMLLLEMAGGRRNADPNANSNASRAYYPAWVYDQLIADQQVDEISNVADMHELERKLCLVGLWCIQMKSHDRPTMSEAIEMLEGDVDALQVPLRPFFCDGDGIGNGMPPPQVMDSYFHSSELTAISEEDDGIAELASS